MKTKCISLLLALILTLSLTAPAFAATEGLHNFQRTAEYTVGQYADIPADSTFAENVKTAYEFNIMQGYGERFGAADNITRLASIIIACRLHAIYHTGVNDIDTRYEGDTKTRYLAYAVENGIFCDFADVSVAASRREYAAILASAMPEAALPAMNTVEDNAIPDVPTGAEHSESIYLLYRAGVIIGSDSEGTFYGDSRITRGAAAAIATRMCAAELRKPITLVLPDDDLSYEEMLETLGTYSYEGTPYAVVNDNDPAFAEEDKTANSYEFYSPLDALGRCGYAYADIGQDLMPTEARGSISSVKPTGWDSVKYDIVSGKYLYNRCHLIGWQLTGENANKQNLITGTRYLNVDGMLPFEDEVAAYVKETGNHVLYRVTPVFTGDNLLADGVLIEAESVEDGGAGVCFCVYCFNVQPGIILDYATGGSALVE